MRRYILNIIIVLVLTSLAASGQKMKIHIPSYRSHIKLDSTLKYISSQSGLYFSYNPSIIELDKTIYLNEGKQNLVHILKNICEQTNLEYEIIEKQIVLKASKNTIDLKKQSRMTFSGYVSDKNNGEALIGATIYIRNLQIGNISNAYGFFSLTIPMDSFVAEISHVGFRSLIISLSPQSIFFRSIELEPLASEITEVTINANEKQKINENIFSKTEQISTKTIKDIPASFGENDVIKSLENITGIKNFGDGSTMYYVRGGEKDQNMILIDDAPIFNPAHMLGFISTLVPEALNDIRIYKSEFPASYGGRLSSVLDVHTKEGNMKQLSSSGYLSPIAARLSIEGPFKKDVSSYFLSFRRSHIGGIIRMFYPGIDNLYFYDLNSKINIKINNRNRIYMSIYGGHDRFTVFRNANETFGLDWGNYTSTLRWNHIFNKKLFSNTTLHGSLYNYFFITNVERDRYWNTSLLNIGLKTCFTYYLNTSNTLRYGIIINSHKFNPGNIELGLGINNERIEDVPRSIGLETAAYLSNEQKIGLRLVAKYGIRLSSWTNIGPSTLLKVNEQYKVYDTINYGINERFDQHYNLEPRISLHYKLGVNDAIKFSYNRTTQYLQLITNSISPFTSLDVWLPSNPNIKPQKADQLSVGYLIKNKTTYISIDAYYKKMYNQIDYANQPRMFLNPAIEAELRFGQAQSYGTEFSIHKEKGKLTGWIAYTYSRIFKLIKDVNNNFPFPAQYDRPHDMNINAFYKIGKRWNLSASMIVTSGASYTAPSSYYYYMGYVMPFYSKRNNARLPLYHRLDISARFDLHKYKHKRFSHYLVLSVFNAYNRKNPFSENFNKIVSDGNIVVPRDLHTIPAIEPSRIYLMGIIPSISYNFQF